MNTPMSENVDPAWWAEKTTNQATDYCPTCEPDVDPIRECVVVSYCRDHDPVLQQRLSGSADFCVTPPYVAPVSHSDEAEAAQ